MDNAYYLLGYVAGDGCLYPEGKTHYVDIASTDLDHLELLHQACKDQGWTISNPRFNQPKIAHWKKVGRFFIRGDGVDWMIDRGLSGMKSKGGCAFTPDGYESQFLRGLLDADGHFVQMNTKGRSISLQVGYAVGNRPFADLIAELALTSGVELRVVANAANWKVRRSGRPAFQFAEWLYATPGLRMKRKRAKYQDIRRQCGVLLS